MPRFARINSTGLYVPEKIVTNQDLDRMLGQNVSDWLVENVGIRERRVMAPEETTSSMAAAAARQALARAGLQPGDLDLLIVATDTPDYLSPATASALQSRLRADNAGTFDVNCACAAWVTGLDMAARYIMTDPDYRHILVVGAYAMTKFLDWSDKYTCTLFADGAAAVIVSAGDQPGYLSGKLLAVGDYHDALGIYTGGSFRPASLDIVTAFGQPHVQFVRKFPATFNSDHWPALVRTVVAKAGLTMEDVDYFLFTQLNLRTIEFVMQNLGQPMSKTHTIMDKWGYLGSACIPAALHDALEQGAGPRPGDHVVFCATGGGMAMAASVWQW